MNDKQTAIFGEFANYYDALYRDKNYEGECNFLEEIFKRYAEKKPAAVLDIGCGTGNHAFLLNGHGYKMTGVDSSSRMLAIARGKAGDKKDIEFVEGDMRNFRLPKSFDAAYSLFFTFSYLTEDEDFISALKSVASHLDKNGLFVFDCWFGPGVLHQLPSDRWKIIENGDRRLFKFSTPDLDIMRQTVDINYKVVVVSKNIIEAEFNETHKLRFFFTKEMARFLESGGLKVLEICPFGKLGKPLTLDDWGMTVVARKG